MTQTQPSAIKAQAEQKLSTAISLHRQGLAQQAEALYREALRLDPDQAGAAYNLGILLAPRRPADAEPLFRTVLRLIPESGDAHLCLGRVLMLLGRMDEALPHLRRAAEANPTVEALNLLGNALVALARFEESLPHYRRAVAMAPGNEVIHYNLGIALDSAGLAKEGLAAFDAALAIRGDLADAHHLRGQCLRTLGRNAEAREAFLTAIRLQPGRPGHYHGLAVCQTFTPDDPNIPVMETLATRSDHDPIEHIALHMGLGKAYDDIGRPADSFAQVSRAAALKHARAGYDEAAALDMLQRIQRTFTPELMSRGQGAGDPSERPIFIVGMPRSGTSLIEQILASHPQVYGAGESTALISMARELSGFPESVANLSDRQLSDLGARYLARVGGPAGALRVTDKLPFNFRHVGLMRMILPNARIIHSRRNAVDNCLSCFTTNFTADPEFNTDLGELGRYYTGYRRLMQHWRATISEESLIEVDYETLVEDFETQARRILAHVGLPWDDACRDFHKTERTVKTASSGQVRKPLYKSAVGRAELYRPFLGPLLEALGETP